MSCVQVSLVNIGGDYLFLVGLFFCVLEALIFWRISKQTSSFTLAARGRVPKFHMGQTFNL